MALIGTLVLAAVATGVPGCTRDEGGVDDAATEIHDEAADAKVEIRQEATEARDKLRDEAREAREDVQDAAEVQP